MDHNPSQFFERVYAAVTAALAGWPEPLPAVAGVLAQAALALAPGAAIWAVGILPMRWWWRREAALAAIRDRLWLESLEPDSREGVLRRREEAADRERRAHEILRQETWGRRA